MSTPELSQEKVRQEEELRIQRQIAFAAEIFQGDVTVNTLLESLAEGVVIIDSSGTILLVNTSAEEMFGYQRKDLIGKPHAVLIPERFRQIHKEYEAHYFEAPRRRHVGELRGLVGLRRNESEFPVEISLSFIETINGVLVLAFVSDITLRKQYESRLQESEELFHLHLECVQDYVIYMLDARGTVLNWNAGAERLAGYRDEDIIGKHFSCFYPEEERSAGKPEQQLESAQKEGHVSTEGWRVRKDGSRFWADLIITALRGETGNLRGFSIATHDITASKRTEDELRKSETKFSTIFHAVPAQVNISTLAEGRFIDVNEACLRTFGYRREEMVGRTSLELGIWKSKADRDKVVRALEEHGMLRDLEINFSGKYGKTITSLFSAELLELDGEPCMLTLVMDITERKRAEEVLQRRTSELEAVISAFPDLYFWIDAEERILDYKTGTEAEADLYAPPEDFLGKMMQDVLPPEVGQQLHEAVRQVLEMGSPTAIEYWLPLGGGKQAFEARLLQLPEDRVFCIVRNITERKRLKEEIEILNADLAARAYELEAANQELEAFNYTVAHDLRKPLTVVNGYCQAIMELCGDKLDEKCTDYLQETYKGTLRMNRLIEALLNFSRMSHVELHQETVDLCDMAKEVAMELKQAEPERRVTFRIADGIRAVGDANLLRVVLDNLLGNAWKYTATREEGIIEFGAMEIAGKQTCFVRDNGTGFNMADAEKLFITFKRLHDAEESKGFGIGLATVERIIRRHGGKVWAEGESGKGATFYFTLPEDGAST